MNYLPVIMIAVYLIFLVYIVWKKATMKEETQVEFQVAGRGMGTIYILFTWLATWFVGATYIGFVGFAANAGVIIAYAVAYNVYTLVIYYYVAPRMWVWGKAHNMTTLPDLVTVRYRSKPLMIFVAIAGVAINLPWQIMGMKTYGFIFSAATGGQVPFNVGMLIIAVVVSIYVLKSGMKAVVVADLYQGILSVGLIILGLAFVLFRLFGNPGNISQLVLDMAPENMIVASPVAFSCMILAGTFGGLCWPAMASRIYVADSVRSIKRIMYIGPVLGTVMAFMLYFTGFAGRALPEVMADPESALLTMSLMAGGPILLGFFSIIILAGEISATDSGLTSHSAIIQKNIVQTIKPDLNEKTKVFYNRIILFSLIVIVYLIATQELGWLINIALLIYDWIIQLLPFIVFGTFWKRGNAYSAAAGMIAGMAMVILFNLGFLAVGELTGGIFGLIVNVAIYVVVALAMKPEPWADEIFEELSSYVDEKEVV